MADVLTESAPERVWLQVDTDGNPDDRREPIQRENWSDLTWCYESIGGQEVVYVRADLAVKALRAARETLACALTSAAPDFFGTSAEIAEHLTIKHIDAALARCGGAP